MPRRRVKTPIHDRQELRSAARDIQESWGDRDGPTWATKYAVGDYDRFGKDSRRI